MARLRHRSFAFFVALLTAGAGAGAARAEIPLAEPRLVADIRAAAQPPAGSDPSWFVAARDHLFFTADDGFSGRELWATAGEPAPPRRLADICPGPCSSSPRWLAAAGRLVYFVASDPAHDERLWRSDGTAAGTLALVDIVPGPEPELLPDLFGTPSTYVASVATAGERLFFVALRTTEYELWTSDGTPGGTRALARLGGYDAPRLLGTAGGVALFIGRDDQHGEELWASDGTTEGTGLLADIKPGPESADIAQPLWTAVSFRGRLYFAADDRRHGRELWVSDGTRRGTRMVRDLVPGDGSSYLQQVVAAAGGIYFVAAPLGRGHELWRSDGTADGTRLVRAPFQRVDSAMALGDGLVFHRNDPARGVDLWIANAASGPRLLRSWPHPPLGVSDLALLARVGGLLLFRVHDTRTGTEMWRTDGTPRGTLRVAALEQGVGLTPFKGRIYFAKHTQHEAELWTSDGTAAGTRRFADLRFGDRSASPAQLTDVAGRLYFAADDGEHGPEVWRSDGTGAGTALVADLAPPPPFGEPPRLLARLGDRLLFATSETDPSYDTVDGSLWITDAAGQGALLLRREVGQAQTPRLLGASALFLTIRAEEQDYAWLVRLWRSDGTTAGTELLAEVGELPRDGPQGWSLPRPVLPDAVVAGGRLYFLVQGVLWRSDGTPAGTGVVANLCGDSCDWFHALAAVGDALYLGAVDYGRHGVTETLWRSDGTPHGTHLLRVLFEGPSLPSLDRLTPAGSRLFFVADDRVHGAELWVSDGTAAGTRMVRDLRPGPAGSHPAWLTAKGGGVFFAADGGRRGQELWWSDGSGPGTRPVRDIAPGPASSYPQELAIVDGLLVFAAFDSEHGLEMWRSDGTAAGTLLLTDVLPGPGSSAPRSFTLSGQNLFFVAGRPRFGYELWALDRAATLP
jgi:ELWxxDGT repeat protein